MSAQSKPIICAPVPTLPIPIQQWRRGQTVGQFLAELREHYWIVNTVDGLRMARKH